MQGMSFLSGFFKTVILLGGLQGLILSGLLFYSVRNRQSNRLLAVLILLMALANINLYLNESSWFAQYPILNLLAAVIPMVIIMPMGPLIYFYIRSFSDPNFIFRKKYRVHFIPVVIDLLPKLTAIIYITGLIFRFFPKNDAPWGLFIDQVNMYSDIPRWISISIYLWVSYRYLKSFKFKPADEKEELRRFPWLEQFLKAFTIFQVIWLLYLVPYVIPGISDRMMDLVDWYPVYIPLSILIYWLGIKGWMASSAKANQQGIKGRPASPIPALLSEEIIARLKTSMVTEKLYLNPALNLAILSKHTAIPAKTISAVLNQQLHKSFNEFINAYRIDAIKERLLASTDKHLTIAGLAYECGFNSQPTFQRAFKAIQGESPSEFLLRNTEYQSAPQ